MAEYAKKIVILGGGFGGIKAAFALHKKLKRLRLLDRYEIILVDKNSYHTYTPTLYEVATTSKNTANQVRLQQIVTFPLKKILGGKKITIIQATVTNVDLAEGDIHFQNKDKLKFDYLILALGSEVNYFNIPGLKENSFALKSFQDAIRLRDAIWNKVDGHDNRKEIQIVIGGGGSTGVELSGEIQEWLGELKKPFPNRKVSVSIVEASPSIMLGFPESVVKKIEGRLKKFGTEIIAGEPISKALPDKVVLKSGREVPYDILIWTGGVKASSILSNVPVKKEARGRVEVTGKMECLPQSEDLKIASKIYGLGDAICFYDPVSGKPMPGVARAALSHANVVAHNIWCDLMENSEHRAYKAKTYPYVVPVGGKWAVAKVGSVIISGFWGWILKELVEINYLISIMPFWKALKIWLSSMWIFIKNDRLG